MESKRVIKLEGRNLNIDKEVLGDQKVLEVGTELPENAKVDKENKVEFENFKILYKGTIDDKCLQDYGVSDDDKLWEDTAKELFLKSATYVPTENDKVAGELNKKEENRRVLKHSKKVEAMEVDENNNEPIESECSKQDSELDKECPKQK